jgi:hypothetical protein
MSIDQAIQSLRNMEALCNRLTRRIQEIVQEMAELAKEFGELMKEKDEQDRGRLQ